MVSFPLAMNFIYVREYKLKNIKQISDKLRSRRERERQRERVADEGIDQWVGGRKVGGLMDLSGRMDE
jgi:hypothetical protein